jgi:hypothetical protein
MSSKGTIKRIVSEKGFGFVADESGHPRILGTLAPLPSNGWAHNLKVAHAAIQMSVR